MSKLPTVKGWIKELRSGKYNQTTRRLKSIYTDSFCCMGVLCDMTGCSWDENGNANKVKIEGNVNFYGVPNSLLKKMFENAGVKNKSGQEVANILAIANDGSGYTFYEIAHALELALKNGKKNRVETTLKKLLG